MASNAVTHDYEKPECKFCSSWKKYFYNRIFMMGFITAVGLIALSTSLTTYLKKSSQKMYPQYLKNRTFKIDPVDAVFLKDGYEFQFVSGSIHYFRIPRMYWMDRLYKAKCMGLDTVQIDIPWNFHEREEKQYTFDGMADVESFITNAEQNGLLVIVRIGPYIGSDWALGGLPPWLLRKHPHIRMRSSSPVFLTAVEDWFNVLLPKLKKHLYHNGGPIIMVQVENEYGSYAACDRDYLAALNAMVTHHLGSESIISTVDVGTKQHLLCGSPFTGNLATVSFGPYKGDPDDKFVALYEFQPDAPWVNSEYYTGWMDHWGYFHYYTNPKVFTERLVQLLSYSPRVSVNIYMCHGGTTFGFWSGAVSNPYSSQISSYDYGAPITEAGDITDFYHQLRQALYELKNVSMPEAPANVSKVAYNSIDLTLVTHMLAETTEGITATVPWSMEAVKQYEGFMLYRTQFYYRPGDTVRLKFREISDYAYVYTASVTFSTLVFHGAVSRNDKTLVLPLKMKYNTTDLVILVENAGYVTYEPKSYNDRKGILGPVSADGKELLGWTMRPVCLTMESHHSCTSTLSQRVKAKLSGESQTSYDYPETPALSWPISGSIFAGILNITAEVDMADTFVQPLNFTRGVVIVNNHTVGRYNQALGPQLRVYVPKSFLHLGQNIFILIELDSLWLNETMSAVPNPEGSTYPLLFDDQMRWQSLRNRTDQ
ncbi:unnamed protein product [Dicrocoelium dendriticum]|nr:unnamed protein product [Dicrocoelium dendriticum]